MTALRRGLLLSIVVALATVPAGAAQAAAPDHAGAICTPVHATGVGQDLGGGKTQATISVGRIVVGQTNALFTPTPSEGATVSFTGPIVFTSAAGTLTAQVAGTLDAATGDFQATSMSIAGTGLLRALNGTVTLAGQENLSTGAFTETITGRLCI